MKRTEQYTEQLSRLYPELHQADEKERILTQTVTFQVTDDCNLACTYCYQIKKGINSEDGGLDIVYTE